MNDSFSALHPALTFCYFAAVLLLTMLVLHPVFLALSLLGALGYCAVLRGWRSLGRTLGWLVPFLVLMAALNALLNHAGVTMLFYLPNGNPVTREALCYGAAAAAMFAAKEAVAKALGTGFDGFALADIEIFSDEAGTPHVRLYRVGVGFHGIGLRVRAGDGREQEREPFFALQPLRLRRPRKIVVGDEHKMCIQMPPGQLRVDLVQQNDVPVAGGLFRARRTFAVVVCAVGKPDVQKIDVLMALRVVRDVLYDLAAGVGIRHTEVGVERNAAE